MFKNVLRVCLAVLVMTSLAKAAASEQRVVPGNACLENSFCTTLKGNVGAVFELIYCLTGEQKSLKEIQEKAGDMPAFIAKISGMPVKQDEILVTLQICDPEEKPLGAWHNGLSKQFNDQPRTWRPSRMWPYSWFAQAKDGEQVKIPMMNSTLLAVLTLVGSSRDATWTFDRMAKHAVGRYLADAHMSEESKKEIEILENQRRVYEVSLVSARAINLEHIVEFVEALVNEETQKIESIKNKHASRLLKEHYGIEMQDTKEASA